MQIPSRPPGLQAAVQAFVKRGPQRLGELFSSGIKPEVQGEYLHWDQLRRRPPPKGLTSEEWWASISLARSVLRTGLPLTDTTGLNLHFARTDGLLLALHQIDRDMGGRPEMADSQLANKDVRDRYLIRSLMEEAITSSQLEGASTTRRVAKDMLLHGRQPRTKDERMIFNNFQAMELLRGKAAEPLTAAFLLELHEVITAGTLEPGEEGRLRRRDENVTVRDISDGQVLHVPPDADELPARIEALCAFANESGGNALVHPVVRAIVLHFALAYDHPFVDGNGRTARALFYWSMIRQRYWLAEFLSISRVIQKAPAQYSRAFLYTETDSSDLTYFLFHQLEVIRKATQDLNAYLDRKSKELRKVDLLLNADASFNHRQRALLAHALRHPGAKYSIEPYRREHGVVYQTARQDLLELEKAGYLRKKQIGRAFHFYPVPELERLLRQNPP